MGCSGIPRGSDDHFENGGKKHILPQDGEERDNVAISKDTLSWREAIEINMKKLMSNVRSSLHRMEKLRVL